MKCPNCGKEIGDAKACFDCGTEILSARTDNIGSDFEPTRGSFTKTKKTKWLIFVIIAVIIIVIGEVAYYLGNMNSPRYIFDKKITQYLTSNEQNTDFDTAKINADIQISVNSEDEDTQYIANLLNDTELSFATEIDKNSKEELVQVQMTKDNDELINAKMKLETESKNMYINLGELFEKTIKCDMTELFDDEEYEVIDTSISSLTPTTYSEKAEKILSEEIKDQLKDEYFATEKVTVDDEKLTENKLIISGTELKDVIENVCNNLADNEKFISCFEDQDSIKDDLNDLSDSVNDLEISDMNFEIDVYTKGLFKTIARVDFVIDEDDDPITVAITPTDNEGEYNYKAYSDDEDDAIEGTIKYVNKDNNFTYEISAKSEDTEVTLSMTGNVIYDEELTNFNTSNAVDYEDLTTEDTYEIFGNFMQSKLYSIIEEIYGSSSSSLLDDEEEDSDNSYSLETTTYDSTDEESSNDYVKNEVKTYDNDVIKFNIPDGFEEYSDGNSDYYRLFDKGVDNERISVDVAVEYDSLDNYLNDLQSQYEDYKKDDDYKNVEISDVEEIEVEENKFKKVVISYGYSWNDDSEKNVDTYFIYELDEDNLYTVEVGSSDEIRTKDFEDFLTIEK